jgi:hypothetical protein
MWSVPVATARSGELEALLSVDKGDTGEDGDGGEGVAEAEAGLRLPIPKFLLLSALANSENLESMDRAAQKQSTKASCDDDDNLGEYPTRVKITCSARRVISSSVGPAPTKPEGTTVTSAY